jgi:hypothetical protein
MCNDFMDDVLGIDPPPPPPKVEPPKIFSQSNNPSAAASQDGLAPESDTGTLSRKRRGRSSLKIDRIKRGSTGLNIPSY